jgi:hypothetical protein
VKPKVNGKALIGIICVALLTFSTLGIASVVVQYYYPNDGSISTAILTVHINDIIYSNNTAIDWGTCKAGQTYTKNMTISNTGNINLTVTIMSTGLPKGWTLTWQANNTLLEPDYEIEDSLILTIPANATAWPVWGFWIYGV